MLEGKKWLGRPRDDPFHPTGFVLMEFPLPDLLEARRLQSAHPGVPIQNCDKLLYVLSTAPASLCRPNVYPGLEDFPLQMQQILYSIP